MLQQQHILLLDSTIDNSLFFFLNDTATTEIYTLSLHDALPISHQLQQHHVFREVGLQGRIGHGVAAILDDHGRSEEHTSELQSRLHLVCRLLLEKKKTAPDSTQVQYSAYSN